MIGRALVALIAGSPELTALIGDRVTPAKFEQAEALPCLFYGTDNIRPIPVRQSEGSYTGTVEIGILARTYGEIMDIVAALRHLLDNLDTTAAGFSVGFEPGVEANDDELPDNAGYYKRIDFEVYASRLS